MIGLSATGHLPNVTNKTVLRAVGNDKQNHRALLFIVLFQAHLKASLERNRDESQSHCSQKELSWVNGPYLVPRESYTVRSKSQPFLRLYVLPKPGLICLQRSDLSSLPMHHQNRILNEPKLQAGSSFKNVRKPLSSICGLDFPSFLEAITRKVKVWDFEDFRDFSRKNKEVKAPGRE